MKYFDMVYARKKGHDSDRVYLDIEKYLKEPAKENTLKEMKAEFLSVFPDTPSYTNLKINFNILDYKNLCEITFDLHNDRFEREFITNPADLYIRETEKLTDNRLENSIGVWGLPKYSEAETSLDYEIIKEYHNFATTLMDNHLRRKYDYLFKECKLIMNKHLEPLVKEYYPNGIQPLRGLKRKNYRR